MKRTIKLNEKDLSRIVKRVIKEDHSNLDDYEKRYSELVNKLSNFVYELDSLANEFEDFSEEIYDDKEPMNDDLLDIVRSSMSYAEIISGCTNKITGYM